MGVEIHNATKTTILQKPPTAGGGLPWLGHIVKFVINPYRFVQSLSDQYGEIVTFKLFGQEIILLTGDEASELFYKSSDEELDQSAAYKLMTPIFGEGLVFDAPLKRKNEQLKMLMPSLQINAMRQHSGKVVTEVEDIIKDWGQQGDIKLVEFMKSLTINTATHCLLGKEFRYELSDEFASIYHDLEKGVSPIAFHFPYLPLPKFKRRDKARARLQSLVSAIIERRKNQTEKPSDMFQSLIDMSYQDGTKLTDNEITGMLIAAIFAGHHTSSGTAAWVLIELLKHPDLMKRAVHEIDELLSRDGVVNFQNLREMPVLENVLKEVLRLHPPLIILMRQVSKTLFFKNFKIDKDQMVWASPPVTHRISTLFSNPKEFDPDRFAEDRKEDKNLMAYQPFGGGKHKCSGNAFALFQIKAIFATLLSEYEFELVDAQETYEDNYSEMIVQPKSPCRVRYKKRNNIVKPETAEQANQPEARCPVDHSQLSQPNNMMQIVVDRGLCQSHAVCVGEAEKYFSIDDNGEMIQTKMTVDSSDLEQIRKAVDYCPNQALKIIGDDN